MKLLLFKIRIMLSQKSFPITIHFSYRFFLLKIMILLISFSSFGQDTIFLDEKWKPISKAKAEYFRLIKPEGNRYSVKDYYISGILQMEAFSLSTDSMMYDGDAKFYSKKGQIIREGSYKNRVKVGRWNTYKGDGKLWMQENYNSNGDNEGNFITYYPSGNVRRQDLYKDNQFVRGKCFTASGADTTWYPYSIHASFPGGDEARIEYLEKNLKYPKLAQEAGIEGTVYISFIISKTAEIKDIKIIRGVHDLLDNEAIRVIDKMPKWNPGMIDGEYMDIQYNMPIHFRFQSQKIIPVGKKGN